MKQATLLCSALIILSCNSKPVPAPPDKQPEIEWVSPMAVSYPAPGIIFGEGVRLRQDSSIQSAVLDKVATGDMLEILALTNVQYQRPSLDYDCEAYPMIQVKTRTGKTGWIYGKYVYLILNEQQKKANVVPVYEKTDKIGPISFDNRTLKLTLCQNFGIGAWDFKEGLTGCSEFYPVLLRDIKTGETFTVSLPTPQNQFPDFKYWCLESDEGAEELVKKVETDSGKITFSIYAGHMTSCSKYQINIVKKDGKYIGTCFNYRYFDEEDKRHKTECEE